MDESEQDKSQAPSRYKLDRARKKGTVARGTDLGFVAGLTALLGWAWLGGPGFVAAVVQATRGALGIGPRLAEGPTPLLALMALTGDTMLRPLAIALAMIFGVALVFELAQTGFVFTAEPLKPDFSRLNPANGFKRVFSLRMLGQTVKNIAKLIGYSIAAVLFVLAVWRTAIPAITGGDRLLAAMAGNAGRLLLWFLGLAVVFAIVDQLLVRRSFMTKMRMSRREVRREHRDREGDPRVKQRRRKLHSDFVKLAGSLRNVRTADVMIVNPQHLAIALRYDASAMAAPHVVSRGAGEFAARLRRLAFIYGVVIVEDAPLARVLYRRSAIGGEIPEMLFKDVAGIYRRLDRRRGSGGESGTS